MKRIQFLIFIILSSFSSFSQNCSYLKNGTYDLVYDSNYHDYPKAQYEILNDTCYIVQNGSWKKYEIKHPYECRFWLISNEIIDTSKMSELSKMLLKRHPFYDIYKVEEDTYYFVLRVDLHVRRFSGKFVKRK